MRAVNCPAGTDGDGLAVGFITWNAPGAGVAITTTTTPPAAVPNAADPNTVLQLDLTLSSGQWAGFTHALTNAQQDAWVPSRLEQL